MEQAEVETVPPAPSSSYTRHAIAKDKAAQLLDRVERPHHGGSNGNITVLPGDNSRVLRKIDRTILPILLTVYCLQYLDKSTLSYASVFGLIKDAHLEGEDYSWLGSIVYVAQLVFQPLVAFLLVKLPIGKFAAAMVLGWGVVLCCMVAATNFKGLMAARFFLGAFEASVAPTFVAITQMWWRRSEQTNRVAAWYSMLGVVNMVGSLLTYGLGHIKSRLHSYQIIFLFCGSLTVAFSIVIFLVMPDSPMEAKFLNENDKLIAIERLRANQMGVSSRNPSGGISTFGPLIVESFGFDSFQTILFNIPFGAVQLVATLGGAYLATRWKRKGPILILLCIPPIIGIAILLAVDHTAAHRGVLLFGYYIISFYPGISPLIYSWSAQNTAGDTKRKCTTAWLFIGQSAGNILGPHLYKPSDKPKYLRGLISNLVLFVVIIALVVLNTMYLLLLNKKHGDRRVLMGKARDVVDQSMVDGKRLNQDDSLAEGDGKDEDSVQESGPRDQPLDKAFDDETDLKNEDFIYVY